MGVSGDNRTGSSTDDNNVIELAVPAVVFNLLAHGNENAPAGFNDRRDYFIRYATFADSLFGVSGQVHFSTRLAYLQSNLQA